MKRIILISALILAFAVSLFGCAASGNPTAADNGNNGGFDSGLTGDVRTAVNLTTAGLSFYTDGGDDVKLSLDNLRLEISLATGVLPTVAATESEADAVFGVRDFSELGANSHIGYADVSYKDGKLFVLASDTESLNLAKDAVLSFAIDEGLIIPEDLSETALFNKNDYRQGKLTVYTEEDAKDFASFEENLYTAPASVTGLPAVVFGGAQLVGKAFSERALLSLASLCTKGDK